MADLLSSSEMLVDQKGRVSWVVDLDKVIKCKPSMSMLWSSPSFVSSGPRTESPKKQSSISKRLNAFIRSYVSILNRRSPTDF